MSDQIWKPILEKALTVKKFSTVDIDAAGEWHTCAVNELFGPIPEMDSDKQETYILKKYGKEVLNLGVDFTFAVVCGNTKSASVTYRKLEKIKNEAKK